jgi:hypothetical protein
MAAIGRKGAGKTYLSTMIAEQMLDASAQVIVIDPVGNWFGLRIAADGRSKGKDIFVIGGEHGDLPMVPDAGAKIARLLVEKRISAVLDISGFRQGERKRFAAEFAEEFFHLKKSQRSAVHLFIEEAQLFAPQRCGPDEARMLGAFENIVRLGRNYGIGATMVTQRPQSVNKEVLSQVECLCVLQVNGTHERKALEEWVQEAGADRKLVGELPGLSRGEGYVWSPSWLKVFRKVKFNSKTTFDASATPEVGKAAKAAKLSDVDVAKLRESLQEVVAKAEQDDPKALRKKIVELEREVAKKPATNVTKVEEKIIEIKVPVIDQAMVLDIRDCVNVFGGAVSGIQKEFGRLIAKFEDVIAEVQKQRTNIPKTIPSKISDLGAPRLGSASGICTKANQCAVLATGSASSARRKGHADGVCAISGWMRSHATLGAHGLQAQLARCLHPAPSREGIRRGSRRAGAGDTGWNRCARLRL